MRVGERAVDRAEYVRLHPSISGALVGKALLQINADSVSSQRRDGCAVLPRAPPESVLVVQRAWWFGITGLVAGIGTAIDTLSVPTSNTRCHTDSRRSPLCSPDRSAAAKAECDAKPTDRRCRRTDAAGGPAPATVAPTYGLVHAVGHVRRRIADRHHSNEKRPVSHEQQEEPFVRCPRVHRRLARFRT